MHYKNYFKKCILFPVFTCIVLCCSINVYAEMKDPELDMREISSDVHIEYVENEIMVKFVPECTEDRVNEICTDLGLTGIKGEIKGKNIFLLGVPGDKSVEDAIEEIKQYKETLFAQPNYKAHSRITPNDTYYGDAGMYGFNKISAPDAWDTITDARSVVVAVLDTGVDYNHPDLSDNMWVNVNEIPDNGIDDDNNGYVDDYRGYDFYTNNKNPMESDMSHYHGTFCSGIIGSVGNNSGGITGVCWRAKIMPLRIGDTSGATSFATCSAITYAANNGAKVMNYSYGETAYDTSLRDAIIDANKLGVLLIAAAGNDARNNDVTYDYPTCFGLDNVISVGATNSSDNLASFSNYGVYTVGITAPGDEVKSTIYANGVTEKNTPGIYQSSSGTSYSAPCVAGACTLVWATDSSLTHLDIKKKILNGADSLSSLTSYINGGRRLNLKNALAYNPNPTPDPVTDLPGGCAHSTLIETINNVGIIVERSMYWNGGGVTWTEGHCATALTGTGVTWYLAEGSTNGFDTYVLIQNPNDTAASVRLTYMDDNGNTVQEDATIQANSRYTRRINDVPGMNNKGGVSTRISSTNWVGIIAERAMYWNAGNVTWAGGHDSVGINNTSTTWYFAEGCTNGFDTWILVQNPNGSDANVTFTYMDNDGNTVQESAIIGANRRYSRRINDVSGMNNKGGVSTTIQSNIGVIAERAMYWDAGGMHYKGGHCTVGVTTSSTTWYLAEGCTNGFDTWILVQNPSGSNANVTFTYMDNDGNTVQESTVIGPNRRYTRRINDVPGMNSKGGVSTKVESTNSIGIIAERAMYWNAGGVAWSGGHCSAGVTGTAKAWYLAEGSTQGSFDEWVLIQNPNSTSSNVRIKYMRSDGARVVNNITVPANSRYTINVNRISGLKRG